MFWGRIGGRPPPEEVQGVVDEGDHVSFPRHGKCVVQYFIQNIMGEVPWSLPLMLCRFDNILMMVHDRLKFLLDGIRDLGGEPDIGF